MSSKETKCTLKLDSVQDEQPLSDSDDDLSSPECLLLMQPVEDDYSSSDEARKKERVERMLNATSLNASDVHIWEMELLGLTYSSHFSEKEMHGISSEDLFTECLMFYFPEGLPESYTKKYKLSTEASWQEIGSVLFRSFMGNTSNQWLKNNYPVDFSKVTKKNLKDVYTKAKELWKFWIEGDNYDDDNSRAYYLASRFNSVLMYLREDHLCKCKNGNKCTHDEDFDYSMTHERIKGLINEIVSYLNIPCLYNGEGRFDFKHKIEGLKSPLSLKVQPDLTLCSITGDRDGWIEEPPEDPFAVFQVYDGTSTFDTLQRTRKASTPSSSQQKLADDLTSMVIVKDSISRIYDDENLTKDKCKQITSCGPETCSSYPESRKLYAQLALQLYGALVQKAESSRWKVPNDPATNLQTAGFFVLNENIYLAKINQLLMYLNKDHIGNRRLTIPEPKLTYCNNLYFDLKLSKHRLSFMALLHHYYRIHDAEKILRWKGVVGGKGYVEDYVNEDFNACHL